MRGNHDNIFLLGNATSSTLYFGSIQLTLGASVVCIHELNLLYLRLVPWALLAQLSFFVCDHTMSGHRFVIAICCRNISDMFPSVRISLSLLVASISPTAILICFPCVTSAFLTKQMNYGPFTPPTLERCRTTGYEPILLNKNIFMLNIGYRYDKNGEMSSLILTKNKNK